MNKFGVSRKNCITGHGNCINVGSGYNFCLDCHSQSIPNHPLFVINTRQPTPEETLIYKHHISIYGKPDEIRTLEVKTGCDCDWT